MKGFNIGDKVQSQHIRADGNDTWEIVHFTDESVILYGLIMKKYEEIPLNIFFALYYLVEKKETFQFDSNLYTY